MKTIDTLVSDIQGLISEGFSGSTEWTTILGHAMATEVAKKFSLEERVGNHYLRPSNLGDKCDRKLWLGMQQPGDEEELPPEARMKFLFGDILEELLLALAAVSGHTVTAQQKEVSLFGITGHIDSVVDGVLLDVKSASSIAFGKFQDHLSASRDSFGYLSQLGFYLEACQNEPELIDKDRAAFLVIDKTLGKLCLDIHARDTLQKDWAGIVARRRAALASLDMPKRGYLPEEDGKSGNLKLGVECSYCNFKHACYKNLRTFLYSTGPRYLTNVSRIPDVPEV